MDCGNNRHFGLDLKSLLESKAECQTTKFVYLTRNSNTVIASFDTEEAALKAVESINDLHFNGSILKCHPYRKITTKSSNTVQSSLNTEQSLKNISITHITNRNAFYMRDHSDEFHTFHT